MAFQSGTDFFYFICLPKGEHIIGAGLNYRQSPYIHRRKVKGFCWRAKAGAFYSWIFSILGTIAKAGMELVIALANTFTFSPII